MQTRTTECQGCDEVKLIPLIHIEDGSPPFEGLCEECADRYGMQVGRRLHLKEPSESGETEVMFVAPAIDAVWVRSYSDGSRWEVPWSSFRPAE